MAPTDTEISKHLDEVHLEGFETLTNMENSIKEKDNMINCIYDCDFKAKSEGEVANHIDIVHLEKDNINLSEKVPKKGAKLNIPCKNGESCRYLRQNRCLYYHEVAAQPEEGIWEEVRPRR